MTDFATTKIFALHGNVSAALSEVKAHPSVRRQDSGIIPNPVAYSVAIHPGTIAVRRSTQAQVNPPLPLRLAVSCRDDK